MASVTLNEIPDVLDYAKRYQQTVLLLGGTGVGKTQIIQQAADRMYPLSELPHQTTNFIYILLSDKDPTDLTGVQVPTDAKDANGDTYLEATYARPDFLPKDPNWKGVVFFDELTNASPPSQQTSYHAMLEHVIGNYKFNKDCLFVAAGNRECDNGSTYELLTPLANRMIIVNVEPDLDTWIEGYAEPNKVHPAIIGFLKTMPDRFYMAERKKDNDITVCTPRSWTSVSGAVYDLQNNIISTKIARVILDGKLSSGVSTEFLAYFKRTHVLHSASDILSGKVKEIKLKENEVDLIYVCIQGCMHLLAEHCKNTSLPDTLILEETSNMLDYIINSFKTHADIITGTICNLTGAGSKSNTASTERNFFTINNRDVNLISQLLKKTPSLMTFLSTYMKEYYALVTAANS